MLTGYVKYDLVRLSDDSKARPAGFGQTIAITIAKRLARNGFSLLLASHGWLASAEENAPQQLEPIKIIESPVPNNYHYIATDNDQPATIYELNQDAINLFGSSGNSNPYIVLNRLPSVYAPSTDAFGLVNIPGATKGMRVRGELNTRTGVTIDGLPLTGINPGPGSLLLFDMENMAGMSMRQGPVAPDYVTFFTTGGAIDGRLLWPKAERGLHIAQSYGSYDFIRTFVRVDSGQLADGSAIFISGSFTDAQKWRGEGSSPDGRTNVEAAWSRPLGDSGSAKILFAYNDFKAYNYRPLTYDQASDLDQWRYFDYLPNSSSIPKQAVNYYGYNRQEFATWSILGEFEYAFNASNKLVFKPYYLSEDGAYFDGLASGKVRQWIIDHDWYGGTLEWQTRFFATDFKFGYWGESANPPGPPTAWKMYTPTASGGLTNPSWSILADTSERHSFNSLYALAEHHFEDLRTQLGLRYVRQTLAGFKFYDPKGVGDVSFDEALALSNGVVEIRSADSFSLNTFLPFLAFDYALTPKADIKLALGRNIGTPAVDVWPVFQQNSALFLSNGITANDLWHSIKPETSDGVDLTLNYRFERGFFAPTAYYARHRHKSVSYDPGIGIAYSQNVGDSQAYGIQANAGWSPLDSLDLFATASYNRNEFVSDLPLMNGNSLPVDGQQLPDVPEYMANLGGTWHYEGFSVSPMMRYIGSRFGDTQHQQRLPGYITLDLNLGYQYRFNNSKLTASLALQNLLDKQYIGFINASYFQLLSNSSAYYYPGAPRTLVAQISLDF